MEPARNPEVLEDLVDMDEPAEKRRVLKDPGEPTMQEYNDHRVDHLPFRSWCPHCVRGRASGTQHRKIQEEQSIP